MMTLFSYGESELRLLAEVARMPAYKSIHTVVKVCNQNPIFLVGVNESTEVDG